MPGSLGVAWEQRLKAAAWWVVGLIPVASLFESATAYLAVTMAFRYAALRAAHGQANANRPMCAGMCMACHGARPASASSEFLLRGRNQQRCAFLQPREISRGKGHEKAQSETWR